MKILMRVPHKGVVAGVIAGFADYFVVDVTLLRILFIFFVLATGFFPGVVAYIAAILIMPVEHVIIHEQKSETDRQS